YDFDMTVHSMPQGFEPSTGLQQYFGSKAAAESSRNLMGLMDPGIDALIDVVVAADTKDDLNTAVKALDRALRAERFWVPQWFKDTHTVAYWDQYDYPEPLPPLARGELDFWWFDADKAATLEASGALQ
ncbi:MAG: ABC transporter substrate-binding protein, partial [Pseudomonadota bacterium]